MNNETIHLIIRNRENVLYDSDVHGISGINAKGPFDILPRHSNFISVIEKYIVIHEATGKTNQMKIEIGVLYVHEAAIDIYLSER